MPGHKTTWVAKVARRTWGQVPRRRWGRHGPGAWWAWIAGRRCLLGQHARRTSCRLDPTLPRPAKQLCNQPPGKCYVMPACEIMLSKLCWACWRSCSAGSLTSTSSSMTRERTEPTGERLLDTATPLCRSHSLTVQSLEPASSRDASVSRPQFEHALTWAGVWRFNT